LRIADLLRIFAETPSARTLHLSRACRTKWPPL